MSHDPLRRSNLDTMTPAEKAIRAAMLAVEEAGADEWLTRAVMFLERAKEAVADYVDGVSFLERFAEHQARRDREQEWKGYVASTMLRLIDADGASTEMPLTAILWPRESPYTLKWREKHYRISAMVPRGVVPGGTDHGLANEIVAHEIVAADPLRDYERDEPPFCLNERA